MYIRKIKFNLVYFLLILSNSLVAQVSCSGLPTSTEILIKLSNKPVTILPIKVDCNFNDSIKRRILYLLDWRWSKKEIDNFLERDIIEHKTIYAIERNDEKISNGNDSLYLLIYDSIKREIKISNQNSISFLVDPNLIWYAGYLKIKEAIPIIKKGIALPQYYDSISIELALARMGDKKMQKKVLSRLVYYSSLVGYEWLEDFEFRVIPKLLYISCQESIYKITEWLDTSKIFQPSSIGFSKKYGSCKAALQILYTLRNVILNNDFQLILSDINYDLKLGYLENTTILKAKNWLKTNKGKYKIYSNYLGNGSVWEWDFNDKPIWDSEIK